MDQHKIQRVLAHLIREEDVAPEAIERAIASAMDMRIGQSAALDGDIHAPMRRAFVTEQVGRLNMMDRI